MRAARAVLGVVGVAMVLFGLRSLWVGGLEVGEVPSLLAYSVGAVVVHDGLLAPVVVLAGVLASRLLPDAWRAPLVVALVVWGGLTAMAVPVLGRFGALADNPTLLDRPYATSWWIGTAAVAVAVVVAGVLRSRRTPTAVPGSGSDTSTSGTGGSA